MSWIIISIILLIIGTAIPLLYFFIKKKESDIVRVEKSSPDLTSIPEPSERKNRIRSSLFYNFAFYSAIMALITILVIFGIGYITTFLSIVSVASLLVVVLSSGVNPLESLAFIKLIYTGQAKYGQYVKVRLQDEEIVAQIIDITSTLVVLRDRHDGEYKVPTQEFIKKSLYHYPKSHEYTLKFYISGNADTVNQIIQEIFESPSNIKVDGEIVSYLEKFQINDLLSPEFNIILDDAIITTFGKSYLPCEIGFKCANPMNALKIKTDLLNQIYLKMNEKGLISNE